MKLVYTNRFVKEFDKLPKTIQKNIFEVLEKLRLVNDLIGFPNCKKLGGFKREFYRIRIGIYRLGFEVVNNEIKAIHIMTIKTRGDIYKTFPPS